MSTLLVHWAAWVSTLACAFTMFSCFLLLVDMPGHNHWIEKTAICAVLFGSAGIAVGPFVGEGLFPGAADVLLRVGVAVFSVWLTSPHWHQLTLFDRRRWDVHGRQPDCAHCPLVRQGEAAEFFEAKLP